MTTIELSELDRDRPHRLTAEQGQLLLRSDVLDARRSPTDSDLWLLSGKEMVGAARIGDLDVVVTPKLPVRRLFFLLGYAQDRARWREDTVELPEAEDLVPAFAHVLWRQVDVALRQGLLQGYRSVDAAEPVLRGRLRETDQIYRKQCRPFPLEVKYDEFTTETAENRILRTAVERMLRIPRVDAQSVRMLGHLRLKLAEVSPLRLGEPIPHWRPTRLNARYHTALRLAEMVLRATSVELGTGNVPVNGFLVKMWRLFEDFVTTAFDDALRDLTGGWVKPQDVQHLDEARRVEMKPDLVWYLQGRPAAVLDAKYTVRRLPEHLYQLLAYCSVLGLSHGHLIYAYGEEDLTLHTVRRSGIELCCHALDLDQPPDALLHQVRQIAANLTIARDRTYAGRRESTEP